MPAQFAPRGTAALQAAQEMGQQMLQAAAIRAANERAARERQMRQQMQAQAIAAEQARMGQAAMLQAARDARLNEYDLQRIDELGKRRQAEQDYEATGGYTALEIEQMAAAKGMPAGLVRRGLVEQKQNADIKREADANFENWKRMQSEAIDLPIRKKIESIEKQLQYVDEQLPKASNAMRPKLEELKADLEFQKRGIPKAPRPDTFEETFQKNAKQMDNGDVIYKDPDSKKITHVRAGNSASTSSGTNERRRADSLWGDDEAPKPDEIDQELERQFASSQPDWYGTGDKKQFRKPTVYDASPESRMNAEVMIRLRKSHNGILYELGRDFVRQGYSPDEAMMKAQGKIQDANTLAKRKELLSEAQRLRVSNELKLVSGEPISLSGGSGDDEQAAIGRLKSLAQQGNEQAQKALSEHGVDWR